MDDQFVPMDLFAKTVKDLLEMVITARKDAVLAKTMAQFPPATPPEERQRMLEEIEQGFDAARRKLSETPDRDVLQALRDFRGPIQ